MDKLDVRTVEQEWINLIAEARGLGISMQEIRTFLQTANQGSNEPETEQIS